MPLPLRIYVAVVVLCSAGILAFLLPTLLTVAPLALLFWLLLLTVNDLLPLTIYRGSAIMTGGSAIRFSTILLFGPAVGALFGAAAALLTDGLRRRVPPVKVVFNAAQLALSLQVAGLVYGRMGGVMVAGHANTLYHPDLRDILPIIVSYLTYFLLNTSLVAGAISLSSGTPFPQAWRTNWLWLSPHTIAGAVVALLFAVLYLRVGWPAVVAYAVWLLIYTRSFRIVMELRDSHRRTLSMLAVTTDAALPHLRGRSEEVAALSTSIAREMGLSLKRRELVEDASLLHNVRLLAVNPKLLMKPGPLSEEDRLEIERQAERGAAILAEVPSLRPVARVLRRSRVPAANGALMNGSRPRVEAHIVGIAEAFENLTCGTPQEGPLPPQAALEILRNGKGAPFDPAVVDALGRLVERGAVPGTDEEPG
jgi:hypothetical protein